MTQAMVFSADDGLDIGVDTGSPVSTDYGSRGNEFNGEVKGAEIAVGERDAMQNLYELPVASHT